MLYKVEDLGTSYYGDELINLGFISTDLSDGQALEGSDICTDFWSKLFILKV